MRFISMFAGIEAASVAWHPLGWTPIAFAEIEPFPSAVLAHHYPDVPNVGDVTAHDWTKYRNQVDLVVAGPPCQAFSVAGLRHSLDDARGNLSLEHIRAIHAITPRWTLTENVPGWLSTKDNAFGCFLAGLVGADAPLLPSRQCGGRWTDAGVVTGPNRTAAWRICDAQYFGLAQRRRRVFVLSVLGTGHWQCAEALLPELESLSGHPPPCRETGQVAPTIPSRRTAGGGLGTDFDCDGGLIRYLGNAEGGAPTVPYLTCANLEGLCNQTPLVAHAIQERAVSDNPDAGPDGKGVQEGLAYTLEARTQVQAVAFRTAQTSSNGHGISEDVAHTLDQAQGQAVAFDTTQIAPTVVSNGDAHSEGRTYQGDRVIDPDGVWPTLPAQNANNGGGAGAILHQPQTMVVRRLTPRECERLQGFPDGYTDVPYRGKPAADGPRYKALGNSMAVNVMSWIGQRIAAVDAIDADREAAA